MGLNLDYRYNNTMCDRDDTSLGTPSQSTSHTSCNISEVTLATESNGHGVVARLVIVLMAMVVCSLLILILSAHVTF